MKVDYPSSFVDSISVKDRDSRGRYLLLSLGHLSKFLCLQKNKILYYKSIYFDLFGVLFKEDSS